MEKKSDRELSALLRAVTLRLDRRPGMTGSTGSIEPELRPQLLHEAVRGNSPRMALAKVAYAKAMQRREGPCGVVSTSLRFA
jgi:hypothetical protein